MLVEKGWRSGGKQIVLLKIQDFSLCTIWHKNYKTSGRPTSRISTDVVRIKHNSKCKHVAKIQDVQVVTLWSNDQVQYHRKLLVS